MHRLHFCFSSAKVNSRHMLLIREQSRWVSYSSLLRLKRHQNYQQVQENDFCQNTSNVLEKYTVNLIAHKLHLPSRFFWPLSRSALRKEMTQQHDEPYLSSKDEAQEEVDNKLFNSRLTEFTWTPVETANNDKLAVVGNLRCVDASSSLPVLQSTSKAYASISSHMELETIRHQVNESRRKEQMKSDEHQINDGVEKEDKFVDENNLYNNQCEKSKEKEEEQVCNTDDCFTTSKRNINDATEEKYPQGEKSNACNIRNLLTMDYKQSCENNNYIDKEDNYLFSGSDGGGIVHSSLIESYTLLLHTVCTQAMYLHGESRWLNLEQQCSSSKTNLIGNRKGANSVVPASNMNVKNNCSSSSSVLGRHANAAERRLRGRLVIYASEQVEPTLLETAKMMCIGHIRTAQTIQGVSTVKTSNNNNDKSSNEYMSNASSVQGKKAEPTLSAFRWTLSSLQSTVAEDLAHGLIPCLVIGVFGSHLCGAIDELKLIGEWCRKVNVWFHIDASYGAWALLGMNCIDAKSLTFLEPCKPNSHKTMQQVQHKKTQKTNTIESVSQDMHDQTKKIQGLEHFKYAQRHLERIALEFSAGAACANSIIILLSHSFLNVHLCLPPVRYADLLPPHNNNYHFSSPLCVERSSTCASMLFVSHVAKFTAAREVLIDTKVQQNYYCKLSPTIQKTNIVNWYDDEAMIHHESLGQTLQKEQQQNGGKTEKTCSSASNSSVRSFAYMEAYMNKVSYRVYWLRCCLRAVQRAIQADGAFDASMQTTCFGFILFRYLMCSDETTELLALKWRERLSQNNFVINDDNIHVPQLASSEYDTNEISVLESEEQWEWWRECENCVNVHVGITVLQKRSWVHLHLSIAPDVHLSFGDGECNNKKTYRNNEFHKDNTIGNDNSVIGNNHDNGVHAQCVNANELHLPINCVVEFVMSQLRHVKSQLEEGFSNN